MLDEKDLESLSKLIDSKIQESESRMMAYFEAAIVPKFNLLADGIQTINE